jgi:hypothetical protein
MTFAAYGTQKVRWSYPFSRFIPMTLPTLIEIFSFPDSGKEEYMFDSVPGSLSDTLFVSIENLRNITKAFKAGYNMVIFPIGSNLVIYEKADSLAYIKPSGEFCVRLAYRIHNETDRVICRLGDDEIEIQPAEITREILHRTKVARCY